MPVEEVSRRIRDALVRVVKQGGDVAGTTAEVTRDSTARALRSVKGRSAKAPRVTEEAVDDAIRAGREAGTDINSVAKGAVIGVIQGVDDVTKVTVGILRSAVRAAIRGSGEVGEDMATVAKKAVEGAIEAGKQAGLKAEDAASAAATGAVEAAGEISETVAAAVTKAVSGTISGVRVVLEAPFKRPAILVVDSNRRNIELIAQHLGREGYDVQGASSLEELDDAIKGKTKIALAVIDITGFDRSVVGRFDSGVWAHCRQLREAKIPVIIVSAQRSPTIQRESMKQGASGVLVKPVAIKELLEHIRALIGERT